MAVGDHFGPILAYFSGDWDVYSGYGILTHGRIFRREGREGLNRIQIGSLSGINTGFGLPPSPPAPMIYFSKWGGGGRKVQRFPRGFPLNQPSKRAP